jgi:hypothetical protein
MNGSRTAGVGETGREEMSIGGIAEFSVSCVDLLYRILITVSSGYALQHVSPRGTLRVYVHKGCCKHAMIPIHMMVVYGALCCAHSVSQPVITASQ